MPHQALSKRGDQGHCPHTGEPGAAGARPDSEEPRGRPHGPAPPRPRRGRCWGRWHTGSKGWGDGEQPALELDIRGGCELGLDEGSGRVCGRVQLVEGVEG